MLASGREVAELACAEWALISRPAPQEHQHDRSLRQLTRERDALAIEIQQGEQWSCFSELRRISEAACRKDRRDSCERSKEHGSPEEPGARDFSQTPKHVVGLLIISLPAVPVTRNFSEHRASGNFLAPST
jgi:hypothetical protein